MTLKATLLATLLAAPLAAQAECNADAVDYSVAMQLANLHCSATRARHAIFSQTFYIYATCLQNQQGKVLGAYLYYDSNTCLRTSD